MNIDWSFLRSVLAQGTDIQKDYTAGKYSSYEEFAARLDSAAHERLESLAPSATEAAADQTDYTMGYVAGYREAVSAAVKVCERRIERRFEQHGITEPDTNASYYTGRDADEFGWKDEEAEECAEIIRVLAAASPAKQPKGE